MAKKKQSHGPLFDDAAKKREAALLALVETSHDEAAIAVYADWLEEQGDLARAAFLRAQQQLAATKVGSPRLLARGRALFDLGKSLDAAWIARITHPKLAGTAWDGRDDDGTLVWRFLATGFVNYTQPSGTFENGRWEQIGITVALETNAHYADYFGVMIGDVMRGNAHNIVGHTWRWKVTRTEDAQIMSVPDNTNRTIHDDHVNKPPVHRTPRRTALPKARTARTDKKPAKPLKRTKPLARKTPVRSKKKRAGRV